MFFNKDCKLVQREEGKEFDFDEYFNEQCILAAKHESDVIILKLRENSLTIPPTEHTVFVDMTSYPTIEKILEKILPAAAEENTKNIAKEAEIPKGRKRKTNPNPRREGTEVLNGMFVYTLGCLRLWL
jgi:hypothetical protein